MNRTCPNCQIALERRSNSLGSFQACSKCDGKLLSFAMLWKCISGYHQSIVSKQIQNNQQAGNKICPLCTDQMGSTNIDEGKNSFRIDVCNHCQLVWFDKGEYEQIYCSFEELHSSPLPSPTAQLIDKLKLDSELQDARNKKKLMKYYPQKNELLPLLLNVPVEKNERMMVRPPYATWFLTSVIVIISIYCFFDFSESLRLYALVPFSITRNLENFVTHIFVHGSVGHLIGNVYFLYVLSDNVEDLIGEKSFLLLFFLSCFVGALFHILSNPASEIPAIGASAGVSGILIFYALQFPKAEFHFFLFVGKFFRLKLPVGVFVVIWVISQVLIILDPNSNIAAYAHFGGAITGVLYWMYYKTLEKKL